MNYGDFCKHYAIKPNPDAFVVWLYFAFYALASHKYPPTENAGE